MSTISRSSATMASCWPASQAAISVSVVTPPPVSLRAERSDPQRAAQRAKRRAQGQPKLLAKLARKPKADAIVQLLQSDQHCASLWANVERRKSALGGGPSRLASSFTLCSPNSHTLATEIASGSQSPCPHRPILCSPPSSPC